MSTLADIRNNIVGMVSDAAGKLVNPDDYDRNIRAAIAHYSRHRPAMQVSDIVGNGTSDYDMPAAWVDEFSDIKSIEFPVGDVPAQFLESEDYGIYQTPTGRKIRLKSSSPSAAEIFRVTFTIPRTETTIPDGDVSAVVNLSAALCLEELANSYTQTSDPTIAADSVNYRSKSSEFAGRAKRYMQLYKEHIGIKEDDSMPAASAVMDLDMKYPGGRERLTHPRWARERR